MTFSFIKMPGATSVNNEPQMLNEDIHHMKVSNYQTSGGDGGRNIHKKYNLRMTQHPDKRMRGGPYGDTVIMHGKKQDLHKFNKDYLGGEEEVKKGKGTHPAVKTNEDVHHMKIDNYQVTGGDGGTNIHKKYGLKMTQHPDKSMRHGPYGDTVVMHGKKDDLHKFKKDWLGDEGEVKKGKIAHPAAKTVGGAPKMKNEALKGDQHKLDHNRDGRITKVDFEGLRSKRKAGKHEDEPDGENGETAGKAGELGKDKMKKDTKEYKMVSKPSMKSMPKKLTMSKESTTTSGYSRIREALLAVVEKKEISHGHLDNKDNYDDKFKGKGAKDMKKDHMKGDIDDTLALARKDVSAAGRRVTSQAKGRNAGDKVSSGDRNIVPGGTKMTDPASPKGQMESIVNAYKSMYTSIDDQQKSLNEAMQHLAKHISDYTLHDDGTPKKIGSDGTPEGGYKRDTHRAQSDNMRMHHKTVASLHRACADKLATDPHHGPGHPLHIVHHAAADAHEEASKAHNTHIGHYDADQHVSADFDVDQIPKSNAKNKAQFGHAMKATTKAMGLSSETHHVAKETSVHTKNY